MAIQKIIDPNRRFQNWRVDEVYTGPDGVGQYVPNLDDKITDWEQMCEYRVVSVDYTTGLSVWQRVNLSNSSGIADQDILTATGAGYTSESFRIWINTRRLPHTLNFDSRLVFYGTQAAYVKVFRGTKIGSNSNVVSAIFNGSGVKTSENIPLELALFQDAANYSVKTPVTAYASDTVVEGEILTVVTYSSDGDVISVSRCLAALSDAVRALDSSSKQVTNIELVSPYLSTTDFTTLQYPLNMILQSGQLQGRVKYSDGTSTLLPVDGTKFSILGLDSYIATEVGQRFGLKLKYTLSAGEAAYGVSAPLPERSILRGYVIQTIESNDSYSNKMFTIPYWNPTVSKWQLRFYLYNINRIEIHDITQYIEYSNSSAVFNGTNYSTPQVLKVAFNMINLGSSYAYYRQIQSFTIALNTPGSNTTTNTYWSIKYTNDTQYGQGLKARLTVDPAAPTTKLLDISNGYASLNDWLQYHFTVLSPLYYTSKERAAPAPSHVRIRIGNDWVREVEISQVLSSIPGINAVVVQGQDVRLEFFKRNFDNDLELAMGSLTAQL